ncbi:MAG TPA: ATP synthase F1 subunit epsilon [Anaerolineales bacterium]|nr:ATP synthase F1 subunit epsilon [Anaerolineales bacterium]
MPIQCDIVSQDRALFSGPADMVIAPGSEGEMGILPNHAPLLTSLGNGFLRVRSAGREEIFVIAGGVMEVRPTVVTVLADVGENVDEIDAARAEAARARAEAMLQKGPPPGPEETLVLEAALRRSTLRLEAVRRYRRGARPTPGARQE